MNKIIVVALLACSQLVGAQLFISPEKGLVDSALSLRAEGLNPGSFVELVATIEGLESSNVFLVDEKGQIDLSKQTPVEGTYSSVDPMGPIWSMPKSDEISFAPEGFSVIFSLNADGQCISTQHIKRLGYEKTVRIPIQEERIVGTLFLPEGVGPFPGMVILGGSEGGISEKRARLMASHGYATFALGYFGADGLPQKLQEIALEDVMYGVDWFRAQEFVLGDQVGIYGVSRGGELSLLLGSLFPGRFAAICAAVPSSIALGAPDNPTRAAWLLNGEAVFPVPYPSGMPTRLPLSGSKEKPIATTPLIRMLIKLHPELVAGARIPVEEIACPVLLVSGGKDGLWPSADFCAEMMPYLQEGEHLYFPEAGHGIGVPNVPNTTYVHLKKDNLWLSMGGKAADNQSASAISWKAIHDFFSEQLSTRECVKSVE